MKMIKETERVAYRRRLRVELFSLEKRRLWGEVSMCINASCGNIYNGTCFCLVGLTHKAKK